MEINVSAPGVTGNPSNTRPSVKQSDPLDGPSFGDWLHRSLDAVNQMKNEADTAAEKLITGENKDVHGTMITMQKATVAMNLMTEVRNKIISAYDEIKRMQF
jgi:flagellar hook-basal body complex protein FliE